MNRTLRHIIQELENRHKSNLYRYYITWKKNVLKNNKTVNEKEIETIEDNDESKDLESFLTDKHTSLQKYLNVENSKTR